MDFVCRDLRYYLLDCRLSDITEIEENANEIIKVRNDTKYCRFHPYSIHIIIGVIVFWFALLLVSSGVGLVSSLVWRLLVQW